MFAQVLERASVVSGHTYALILTSKRLKEKLLPEGIARSPYEVLDYEVTLTLHDCRGVRATHTRNQRVPFLQNGISGLLNQMWGEGDYSDDLP